MFKNLDQQETSLKSFQAFKNFTWTNNDSGSRIYAIKAVSQSQHNYASASDTITNFITGSTTQSFYALPTWHVVNNLYYKRASEPYGSFGGNDVTKTNRELHTTARVFSIPREVFGEELKPGSIRLSDTSNGQTWDIRDDGDGNLYDFAHSASFSAYKSSSFDRSQGVQSNGSGSEVGNVFYEHGIMVITDTGSYYDVGTGTGYTLKYKATQTIREYEYAVVAGAREFNTTTNISVSSQRSGSVTIKAGSQNIHNFFGPGDNPTGEGTGSFKTSYDATETAEAYVTHSEFRPYVSTIGLYNDNDKLLVVGKLAKAIKLSDELDTTFIVRFDV